MNSKLYRMIATGLAIYFILIAAGQSLADAPKKAGVSTNELAAYELQYYARVMQTLENELRLHVNRPELLADGYEWLTTGIERMRSDLLAAALPDETKPLRDSLIALAEMLPPIAESAHQSDEEATEARYQAYSKATGPYYFAFRAFVSGLEEDIAMVTSGSAVQPTPDADWMPDIATRNAYKQAVQAMDARRYRDAADLLISLLPKVKNTPAESFMLHRVLECFTLRRSPLRQENDRLGMLELLQDHLDRRVYSPRLPVLYFYWQTFQQINSNGLSNYSTIDYPLHNRMFRQCADVIIERIRSNPSDIEARSTMWALLGIPTIQRFPTNYFFGNSVAMHYAHLSGPFEDEDALGREGE